MDISGVEFILEDDLKDLEEDSEWFDEQIAKLYHWMRVWPVG